MRRFSLKLMSLKQKNCRERFVLIFSIYKRYLSQKLTKFQTKMLLKLVLTKVQSLNRGEKSVKILNPGSEKFFLLEVFFPPPTLSFLSSLSSLLFSLRELDRKCEEETERKIKRRKGRERKEEKEREGLNFWNNGYKNEMYIK